MKNFHKIPNALVSSEPNFKHRRLESENVVKTGAGVGWGVKRTSDLGCLPFIQTTLAVHKHNI